MKMRGFIKVNQGDYSQYNTLTIAETTISGILECLKLVMPDLYLKIINQEFDQDGYLDLTDLIMDVYPTDDIFKNVILTEFFENGYFKAKSNSAGLDADELDIDNNVIKLSKDQLKQKIGVFILCRFKCNRGVEINQDNLGTKFNLNKIICYYDPDAVMSNKTLQIAGKQIQEKLQSFLDDFVDLNPSLERFKVLI